MAAVNEVKASDATGRRGWRGLPMGVVVGRYFVYVIVGLLAIVLWAQLSLRGMLQSGEVYPADYGSEHVEEVLQRLAAQDEFDPGAIPSAYWYLLIDEKGNELASDLGDEYSILYSVAESLKGTTSFPDWYVEELPRYYDIWGSAVHHHRFAQLDNGTIVLLAYQNLPQYATRELRDSRPNVLVQLGWTCVGAGAALIVGVGAWAAHVISRKLRPAAEAAARIEASDLDSPVGRSNVRQVNDLLAAMERMRAALFDAYRELWRTADDRRRLNAAFAHDLRTPVTVLKGTVEMAQTQAREREAVPHLGGADDAEQDKSSDETVPARDEALAVIAEQVERLERYAAAMAQATKLEDRTVAFEAVSARTVAEVLERQASSYVASCGKHRELVFLAGDGLRSRLAAEGGESSDGRSDAFMLDLQVVEEALGNVLSNACAHAANRIGLTVDVNAAGFLVVVVEDDGPGFSAEALHHGCDAFYSEQKSAEHFGLGLNVANVLTRLHGGDIELANAPGGGARVTMTFAAQRAES